MTAAKHLDKCREIAGWGHAYDEDDFRYLSLWRDSLAGTCNAPARLEMLWADELRRVSGFKGSRRPCIIAAGDGMTGAQVRRAVCAELRARTFPRADAAVPHQSFEAAHDPLAQSPTPSPEGELDEALRISADRPR